MTKDIIKEALEDVKRIKVLAEENAKKTVKTIAQKHAEKLFTESFDMESEFEDDELMSEEELDDVINELDMDDDMEDTQSADEFVDDELGMGSEFGSLDEDELDDALADFSDEGLDEEVTDDETSTKFTMKEVFKDRQIKIVQINNIDFNVFTSDGNKKIASYDISANKAVINTNEIDVNTALSLSFGIKQIASLLGKEGSHYKKTKVGNELLADYLKNNKLMEDEGIGMGDDDDLDSALMEFDDMEDMGGSDEELDSALMEFDDMEEDELDGALAELDEADDNRDYSSPNAAANYKAADIEKKFGNKTLVDKTGALRFGADKGGYYPIFYNTAKGYAAFCNFNYIENTLTARDGIQGTSIMPDGGDNKYNMALYTAFRGLGVEQDTVKVYKFKGITDGTLFTKIYSNFKTDHLDETMDMYDEDELDNAIEETKGIGFGNRSHQSQEGNGGIKGSDSYGSKNRGMNEAVVKKLKDALRGKISREKKLEEAIGIYKEQLEKLSVLNTNMAHVTTIFLENASTKDEKIAIAKRFDKVSDVKQSKKLYEAISLELQGKKTPTKNIVNKKVRGMVIESKANINESKNEDPSFRLMRNMGMFD